MGQLFDNEPANLGNTKIKAVDPTQDALRIDDVDGTELLAIDESGALTVANTLAVTGVSTPTGGVAPISSGYTTFWGGGVPITLATMGNDTACDDGSRWVTEVFIPYNVTLTGIAYLIGSVGGTDDVIVELKDASGASLANSILDASVIVGTAANVQSVPFTATKAVVGPATFFLVVQFNGTTAKLRTHTIPGLTFATDKISGTFTTLAAITAPTTFTANEGPVITTY